MQLQDIAADADAHAKGEHSNLGTRTIARWVADIAKALTRPQIIAEQLRPFGHIEGQSAADAVGPFKLAFQQGIANHHMLEQVRAELQKANNMNARHVVDLEAERKCHEVTASALDKFQSTCADQAIQLMELRGEVKGLRDSEGNAVAREQAKAERMRIEGCEQMDRINERYTVQLNRSREVEAQRERCDRRIAQQEALISKYDAQIDEVTGPHREGETYADAAVRAIKELTRLNQEQQQRISAFGLQLDRLRDRLPATAYPATLSAQDLISDVIEEAEAPCPDCKVMAAQLDERGECLRVADADRVPLAMDLENANGELADLKAAIERIEPVMLAVKAWRPLWRESDVYKAPTSELIAKACELSAAWEAFETATQAALKAQAADDIGF